MSLFNEVPDGFPVDADVSNRPVNYTLKSDISDRVAFSLLIVMWTCFAGVFGCLFGLVVSANVSALQAHTATTAQLAAVAAVVGLSCYWSVPKFNSLMQSVDVRIDETDVHVRLRQLTGTTTWSRAINDFEGVAMLNLGTHLVDQDKVPIASVVLKHPDPALSVPLAIKQQKDIGKRTVARKAKQLGVPELEGMGNETGEAAYPDGTIIVNRGQSFVLRAFYWLLIAVGIPAILGSMYALFTQPFDVAWLFLLGFTAASLAAMHIYADCYVTDMVEHEGAVWIRTAALRLSQYKIAHERIVSVVERQARTGSIGSTAIMHTNTPWTSMRVKGHVLPFVIDMQADYVNTRKLSRLHRKKP